MPLKSFSLSPGKLSVFSCRLIAYNPTVIVYPSGIGFGLFVIHQDIEISKDCASVDPAWPTIREFRSECSSRMSAHVATEDYSNHLCDFRAGLLFAGMIGNVVEDDVSSVLVLGIRQAGESAGHVFFGGKGYDNKFSHNHAFLLGKDCLFPRMRNI
jgi:hypothetical protein